MYHNLLNEIDKSKTNVSELAIRIGVPEKILWDKINGMIAFTWPEVLLIRQLVSPDTTLELLFRTSEAVCRSILEKEN